MLLTVFSEKKLLHNCKTRQSDWYVLLTSAESDSRILYYVSQIFMYDTTFWANFDHFFVIPFCYSVIIMSTTWSGWGGRLNVTKFRVLMYSKSCTATFHFTIAQSIFKGYEQRQREARWSLTFLLLEGKRKTKEIYTGAAINCIECLFAREIERKSRLTSCRRANETMDPWTNDPVFSQSEQVIRRDSHSYKGIKRQAPVEKRRRIDASHFRRIPARHAAREETRRPTIIIRIDFHHFITMWEKNDVTEILRFF